VDADTEAYWELDEKGWMQTRKLTGNWRKKGGCRQGSMLRTGGRGWMQTGKHAWNGRNKGVGKQGSILRTGGRRVNADREDYWELEVEEWM
jgi:hypothetical protein